MGFNSGFKGLNGVNPRKAFFSLLKECLKLGVHIMLSTRLLAEKT